MMGNHEEIRKILTQSDTYKVEGKKLFGMSLGDWSEKKPDARGQVQLKLNGVPKMYLWSEVEDVLFNRPKPDLGVPDVALAKEVILKNRLDDYDNRDNQLVNAARARDESGINEDELPKRTSIRSAEIKVIRKMLEDNKTSTEIAKAINKTLHSVMYVVKQIKEGKTLKFEKQTN